MTEINRCKCGSLDLKCIIEDTMSSINCKSCDEFILIYSDYIDVIKMWNNGIRGEQEPDYQGC